MKKKCNHCWHRLTPYPIYVGEEIIEHQCCWCGRKWKHQFHLFKEQKHGRFNPDKDDGRKLDE